VAHSIRVATGRAGASALLQGVNEIQPRAGKCRREAEKQGGSQRDGECESKDAPIDSDLAEVQELQSLHLHQRGDTEIRRRLHDLDPELPLADVKTMDEVVAQQTGGQRFTTVLFSLFALAGLALAIVGIYGVISYLVARRTQELAVHLALGATPSNILWLVLRQGLKMAAVGAAMGLFGAFAVRQLMSDLLFGVSPLDPPTLVGASICLLVVALLTSAVPGARAMRIQLVEALRED
jgi:predicted lysophospholipase L1 biosynthesis ABC-type transport system permease subunit